MLTAAADTCWKAVSQTGDTSNIYFAYLVLLELLLLGACCPREVLRPQSCHLRLDVRQAPADAVELLHKCVLEKVPVHGLQLLQTALLLVLLLLGLGLLQLLLLYCKACSGGGCFCCGSLDRPRL